MKKHLLKSLLALALVLVCGNAWGETVTYKMTIDSSENGNNNVHWIAPKTTLSYNSISWDTFVEDNKVGMIASRTYCQIGKKDAPATKVTISTKGFAGKKIVKASLTGYCMSNEGPTLTITAGNTIMLNGISLVKTNSTTYTSTNNNIILGPADELTFSVNSSAKAAIAISEISVDYEESENAKTLTSITISGTPDKTEYKEGDTFDPAGLVVTGTYSEGDPEEITDGITWAFDPEKLSAGQTSVSVSATVGGVSSEAYTVDITVNGDDADQENEVIDVLTADKFAATTTSYKDFSYESKTSGAVYAGNSAKDTNGNIQLRSNNSESGIVCTQSAGIVSSVKITVGSGTKQIDVYGNNTPYTSAAELYATGENSNQGTKIGSLTQTGTIDFKGDYQYIGIRSYSGAIYLSSIEITWKTPTTETVTLTGAPSNGLYYATFIGSTNMKVDDNSVIATCFVEDGMAKTNELEGNIIPANSPVIVYTMNEDGKITLTQTTEDASAEDAEYIKDEDFNMLFGYTEDTHVDAADNTCYYALNVVDGQAGFFVPRTTDDTTNPSASNGFTAKAGKAYLKVVDATPSNGYRFGGTTLIEDIKIDNDAVYYNLLGQKVENPTNGLYIHNGKKVYVK